MIKQKNDDKTPVDSTDESQRKTFNDLYSCHARWIYSQIKVKVKDEEVAKDLSQQVWIAVWENIGKIGEIADIRAFLFTIVSRQLCALVRRSSTHTIIRIEEEATACAAVADIHTPENDLGAADIQGIVLSTLRSCPKMLKQIYELRSCNFSTEEVAEKLGLSTRTVYNGYSRMRLKIQEVLVKSGVAAMSVLLAIGCFFSPWV